MSPYLDYQLWQESRQARILERVMSFALALEHGKDRIKVGLLRVDLCSPVSACVNGCFVQLCPSFQLSEGACHASGLTYPGPWDQCAGMGGQWSYCMHQRYQSTPCQFCAAKIFEILKYASIMNVQHSLFTIQHAL